MAVECIGTDADETFAVAGSSIQSGVFDGRGGVDTLQLLGSLGSTFDFRAAATFTNFEKLVGTASLDSIFLTSDQFAELSAFEGIEILYITGGTVDLRAKTFDRTYAIGLLTDNVQVTVDDPAIAMKLGGRGTSNDHLKIEGFDLTDEQRLTLHRQGIDQITDRHGVTSIDTAPVLTGLAGDRVIIPPQRPVHLDAGRNATLSDDNGPISRLTVSLSPIGGTVRFGFDTSSTVATSGDVWGGTLFVDGVEIGSYGGANTGTQLTLEFNDAATPERVQEVIRAITYENYFDTGAMPFDTRQVTLTVWDDGGRASQASWTIENVNIAPSSPYLQGSTIAEHSLLNARVGRVVPGDPNSGDKVTLSLINDAGGRFKLKDGYLVVADGSKLDFEQSRFHKVTIRATDTGGLTTDKTYVISVIDVLDEVAAGTAADDVLVGGKGKDTLVGRGGADKLTGGLGADKLLGGLGSDVFVFKSVRDSAPDPVGRDIIYDFSAQQKDKINLSLIDANIVRTGDQAFSFIGKQAFHNKAGELRYEQASIGVSVQGDINGDGKADFTIFLKAVAALRSIDFIL